MHVLFTTNCLMPVQNRAMPTVYLPQKWSLIPEIVHIGEDKDFTPVIEKALELGGYCRRPAQNRNQWRHLCHDRILPTKTCTDSIAEQSDRRCKKRRYPSLLPCGWMRWCTTGKKLLHGICKTDTKGYDHPHARLWEISFQ